MLAVMVLRQHRVSSSKTAGPHVSCGARCMGHTIIGSAVNWLKHRNYDQHDLGSKPTGAILLYPWSRHFMALSPNC